MVFNYKTKGTCSREIVFEIENNKIQNVTFLVEGMDIDDVISRVEGIRCGSKTTSCPDQLAQALKAAKEHLA